MKKIVLIVALFAAIALMPGCSKDDVKEQELEYIGNWSGTYSGDDEGSWKVLVDEKGGITGTMTSDNLPITLDFMGNVDKSGKVSASFENQFGKGTMEGQMTDGKMVGTWSNDSQNIGGIIEGSKDK